MTSKQPVHKFLICVLGPSGSYDFPVGISPETAARRDMAAFLEFADEVARVAGKARVENGQLRMFGEKR